MAKSSWAPLCVVIGGVLSLSSAARAQVFLGAEGVGLESLPQYGGLNDVPLFLDSAGFETRGNPLTCTDPAGTGEFGLTFDIDQPDSLSFGESGVAAAADGDVIHAFAWGFDVNAGQPGGLDPVAFAAFRSVCNVDATMVLALRPGAVGIPAPLDPGWVGALPITDTDIVYLPLSDGWYAFDTTAPTPPVPFADRARIQSVLDGVSDPYPWTNALPAAPFSTRSAALSSSGNLITALTERLDDGSLATWLVTIAPDGAATVLETPGALRDAGIDVDVALPLFWDPRADALLLPCGGGGRLCLVEDTGLRRSETHLAGFDLILDPTGSARTIGAMFPCGADVCALEHPGQGFARLLVDPARFDPDRDGLPDVVEAAAGTDRFLGDTDGDGVEDGAELRFFDTNPLDAQSAPPTSITPIAGFAPSTRQADWARPLATLDARGATPGVACGPATVGVDADTCVRGDGTFIREEPFVRNVQFTADLTASIEGPVVTNLVTGVSYTAGTGQLFPGYGMTVFEDLDGGFTLRRWDESGSFDVVALLRTDCPFLASPTEEATRCADPGEELLDGSYVQFAGHHAPTRATLFIVQTDREERFLVAITPDRIERIRGLEVFGERDLRIGPALDGEHAFATLVAPIGEESFYLTLDPGLRPLWGEQARGLLVSRSGPWFRDGILTGQAIGFHQMPPPPGDGASGGCTPPDSGGVSLCAFSPSRTLDAVLVQTFVREEWVPVPLALEPGESLFFASQKNRQTNLVTEPVADWGLWRLTRRGGSHKWLDQAGFSALLDTSGRSAVAGSPFGNIVAIGVHPGLKRVCLIEEQPLDAGRRRSRLWELTVGARGPSGIALVGTGGVVACNYEGDALVHVADDGGSARLVLPSGEVPLTAPGITGMTPIPRGFLTWSNGGSATCVRDGEAKVASVRVIAAIHAEGFVRFVDQLGVGWIAPPEHVCDGIELAEALSERTVEDSRFNLWTVASTAGAVAWQSVGTHMHISLTPEGSVLFAPQDLTPLGATERTFLDHDRFFRLRPSYTPYDWSNRLEALDPKRFERSHVKVASVQVERLTALTWVPADALIPDEWEFLGQEPDPPYLGPIPAEPPPPPPEPPLADLPEGCTCRGAAAPDVASTAAFALLLAGLRRRTRGAARPPLLSTAPGSFDHAGG